MTEQGRPYEQHHVPGFTSLCRSGGWLLLWIAAAILCPLLLIGCQHASPASESATSQALLVRPAGFAGVPFGAPLEEVHEAVMQRPGVRVLEERRGGVAEWIQYCDPHYRGYPVRYSLCTAEQGLYFADVWFNSFTASGQEVVDQFVAVANDLSRQYGPPHEGRGQLRAPHVADPASEVSLRWWFPADGEPRARGITLEVRHVENHQGRRVPCLHLYVLDHTRLPGERKATRHDPPERAHPPTRPREVAEHARDDAASPAAGQTAGEAEQAAEQPPTVPEQPVLEELPGFLGVPFGSRAAYTQRVLLARLGVLHFGPAGALSGVPEVAMHGYLEPDFAGHAAVYELHYFQDRLIMASVLLVNQPGTAAHARHQFDDLLGLLTTRYGPADSQRKPASADAGGSDPPGVTDAVWAVPSPVGHPLGRRVRLVLEPRVTPAHPNPGEDPVVRVIYSDMDLRHLAADALAEQQKAK